jgi:acetyl esterase/lipase
VNALQIVGSIVALILSALLTLAELWTLVPAPTIATLALAVLVPESAMTFAVASALVLALVQAIARGWARTCATLLSAAAFGLALIPLGLEPSTAERADREMRMALGPDYAVAAPDRARALMLPAPFDPLTALRGFGAAAGIRVDRNRPVVAPDGTRLALDLYRPAASGPHPAVIVIYGGAWIFGTRADSEELARSLAALGYTAIAVDYRKAPRFHFPTQVEDVRAALATVANHAREWDVDPARVAIVGRSAGAELALLAAYAPETLTIKAVVAFYAPIDLVEGWNVPPRPDPANVRRILLAYLGGSPQTRGADYAAASPLAHVRTDLPPTLLIGGARDELVQLRFQREMRDALRLHGVRTASIEVPWSNHAFDEVPAGVGGQLARYYMQRFLAATL